MSEDVFAIMPYFDDPNLSADQIAAFGILKKHPMASWVTCLSTAQAALSALTEGGWAPGGWRPKDRFKDWSAGMDTSGDHAGESTAKIVFASHADCISFMRWAISLASRDHAPTTCAATPKSAAPEGQYEQFRVSVVSATDRDIRRVLGDPGQAFTGGVTISHPGRATVQTRAPQADRESSREDQKPNVPNTIREGE